MQAGLFDAQDSANVAERREANLQHLWSVFGWRGPEVGGMCEIDIPIPDTPDGSSLYCYMEQARLIEQQPDGLWLAEIAMPGDWLKNGRRGLLDRHYIGPPRKLIRQARSLNPTGESNHG